MVKGWQRQRYDTNGEELSIRHLWHHAMNIQELHGGPGARYWYMLCCAVAANLVAFSRFPIELTNAQWDMVKMVMDPEIIPTRAECKDEVVFTTQCKSSNPMRLVCAHPVTANAFYSPWISLLKNKGMLRRTIGGHRHLLFYAVRSEAVARGVVGALGCHLGHTAENGTTIIAVRRSTLVTELFRFLCNTDSNVWMRTSYTMTPWFLWGVTQNDSIACGYIARVFASWFQNTKGKWALARRTCSSIAWHRFFEALCRIYKMRYEIGLSLHDWNRMFCRFLFDPTDTRLTMTCEKSVVEMITNAEIRGWFNMHFPGPRATLPARHVCEFLDRLFDPAYLQHEYADVLFSLDASKTQNAQYRKRNGFTKRHRQLLGSEQLSTNQLVNWLKGNQCRCTTSPTAAEVELQLGCLMQNREVAEILARGSKCAGQCIRPSDFEVKQNLGLRPTSALTQSSGDLISSVSLYCEHVKPFYENNYPPSHVVPTEFIYYLNELERNIRIGRPLIAFRRGSSMVVPTSGPMMHYMHLFEWDFLKLPLFRGTSFDPFTGRILEIKTTDILPSLPAVDMRNLPDEVDVEEVVLAELIRPPARCPTPDPVCLCGGDDYYDPRLTFIPNKDGVDPEHFNEIHRQISNYDCYRERFIEMETDKKQARNPENEIPTRTRVLSDSSSTYM